MRANVEFSQCLTSGTSKRLGAERATRITSTNVYRFVLLFAPNMCRSASHRWFLILREIYFDHWRIQGGKVQFLWFSCRHRLVALSLSLQFVIECNPRRSPDTVEDPGFPRGYQLQGALTYIGFSIIFAKKCMKMKKSWLRGGGGGASLDPPLRY